MTPEHDDPQVRAWLNQWQAPAPDADAKARLLAALAAEPLPAAPKPFPRWRHTLLWSALILRAQVKIVHPATWALSLLFLALGSAVVLALAGGVRADVGLPLALVAPLVAAVGAAFLYGEDTDPALELQQTLPTSPRLVLLARLTLLFGFDLVLCLVISMLLAAGAGVTLGALIASWLAPMTFLCAFAFLLSVVSFDPLLSSLISFLMWAVQVYRTFSTLPAAGWLPDLLAVETRPALLLASAILISVALWWSDKAAVSG